MKLTFAHAGTERTLAKHNDVMRQLKAGVITNELAAQKPWLFRLVVEGKQRTFTLSSKDKEAVREAKDILNGQTQQPTGFAAFLAEKDAKRSITIGELATDWLAAGLPFRKTESRTPEAADRLRATINRALAWWATVPVATITANTLEDFAGHRKPALRSADLEMAAVSSLCQWAVFTARISANPLAKRPTFAKVGQHCHEACPDDDETLHKLLAYLFDPIVDIHHKETLTLSRLAAGTLAFCALTGLRPGEPAALLRVPPLAETPRHTRDLEPGTIFRDRAGALRMKVARLKRGQNPFVTLHPAAESFLSAWRSWLAANLPDAKYLFPLGTDDQTTLNRALNRASAALKLPHFKPHAMRAFYVKVRRSQGEDDATISGELGQTTNGELIRSVYGDPQDLIGGQLFDWLPEDTAPAWDLLAIQKPVVIQLPAIEHAAYNAKSDLQPLGGGGGAILHRVPSALALRSCAFLR